MAGSLRVTHPSATFLISTSPEGSVKMILVRLACVMHAASVNPEPGSNSQKKYLRAIILTLLFFELLNSKFIDCYSVIKVRVTKDDFLILAPKKIFVKKSFSFFKKSTFFLADFSGSTEYDTDIKVVCQVK